MVVYWLYNITGDKFLLDLGELIHKQTFNWTDIFLNQDHLSRQLSLHCVNLAQGFKEPVVYYQQNQDPKQICAVKKAVKDIHNTIVSRPGFGVATNYFVSVSRLPVPNYVPPWR